MQYLDEFMEYMKLKNYAHKTMEWYRDTICECGRFLDNKPERAVTESDISRYIEYLYGKDISVNTVYKSIVTMRKYFEYLVEHNKILVNPMLHVELPRQVKEQNTCFSVDEVTRILESVATDSDRDLQGRAILELLYSTAMRPGELLGVKMGDVDFDNGFVVVRHTKTRRDRTIPVGVTALYWLRRYVSEVRVKFVGKLDHEYLFFPLHTPHELFNYHRFKEVMKALLKRHNIKPFNLYALRVSSATHLLQNGASTMAIKDFLGHVNVYTTVSYLKVSADDLKKQLLMLHPRNIQWRQHEV